MKKESEIKIIKTVIADVLRAYFISAGMLDVALEWNRKCKRCYAGLSDEETSVYWEILWLLRK